MMDQARIRLTALTERVDAFSLRERALMFISILVVLYLVAANLVFAPLATEQERLRKQLANTRDQIQLQERQIQIIAGDDTADGQSRQARVTALRDQLRSTDEALARATTGLVPSREMARLVERMLAKNPRLVLTKVESLPPSPLFANAVQGDSVAVGVGTASTATAAVSGVYKHGMRIELSGRYLDILRYLKALEELPWKIFWAEIALETDAYPTSRLTLLIHTLSFQEGWIAI